MKSPSLLLLAIIATASGQFPSPPGNTPRTRPTNPFAPEPTPTPAPAAPIRPAPPAYNPYSPTAPSLNPYSREGGPRRAPRITYPTLAAVDGTDRFYRTAVSGEGSAATASEVLDERAVLVGFECTVANLGEENRATVTSLLPHYEIGGVRKAGKVNGSPNGNRSVLSAKPGYAVSMAEVWEEVRQSKLGALARPTDRPVEKRVMCGLRITFAKLEADGTLSPTDQYTSVIAGTEASFPKRLECLGITACGISAVYSNSSPTALSLLISASTVKSLRPNLVPGWRPPVTEEPVPAIPVAGAPVADMPIAGIPGAGAPVAAAPVANIPVATLSPDVPSPLAPTAEAALGNPRISELSAKAGLSFAFVEGDGGAGSAFICDYQGKRMLFTNQHVVRENPQLKFTMLDQSQVKLGITRAAVGHDLIGFEVADPLPALFAEMDFPANVAIGDEVLVIGNTEGQRVLKPLPGRITGLGPNLVEVTSQFMPGNSGSPILHVKSGRVIGIATYAIIRSVDSLTGEKAASVRRFGYRLDSVQQWQPVNWPAYQAEAAASSKVHAFSNALLALLRDLRNPKFNPDQHTDPRLKPALAFLKPLISREGKSQGDTIRAVQNFLGELKNVSQRDVEALRGQIRYDFFQREMVDEAKFRTELAKALGEAVTTRR